MTIVESPIDDRTTLVRREYPLEHVSGIPKRSPSFYQAVRDRPHALFYTSPSYGPVAFVLGREPVHIGRLDHLRANNLEGIGFMDVHEELLAVIQSEDARIFLMQNRPSLALARKGRDQKIDYDRHASSIATTNGWLHASLEPGHHLFWPTEDPSPQILQFGLLPKDYRIKGIEVYWPNFLGISRKI